MDPNVQNAIARIEVMRDGEVVSRGTASLVGENLILTASMLLHNERPIPSGSILARFGSRFPTICQTRRRFSKESGMRAKTGYADMHDSATQDYSPAAAGDH